MNTLRHLQYKRISTNLNSNVASRSTQLYGHGIGLGFGFGLGLSSSLVGAFEASDYAYFNSDMCVGRYDKSCYIIVNESLTWQQASNRCRAMFGHLATIENQTEKDVIHSLIASKFYM